MSAIWYGDHVPGDGELRLCGDLSGKRVIELGIAATANSLIAATEGAKAIALDPSAEAIAVLRAAAERAEVRVECHQGELADLGFATSGSVDLVVAAHTLDRVDDVPRLLRQVHRVLKPGAPFVVASTHPVARMFADDGTLAQPYGANHSSFAELYLALDRTNFHLDAIHELPDRRHRDAVYPAVLVLRASKQGS
ncbi:MAG: class I SAM-dependent methyltransferase [Ilumatobacteraceae bacterium]